jgi:catechol 2,3-dioxygenase-like lactoylglutathione lyase family enzyme
MTMKFFRGRLLDHLHLRVASLEKSKRFYRAALAALGRQPTGESERHINFDELWIDEADAAGPSRAHIAFQAKDQEEVRRFHAAGLSAGGRDNGAPGEREYHPGYYAAFLLDPDGHNVEAVWHGPAKRSTEAVEITWG